MLRITLEWAFISQTPEGYSLTTRRCACPSGYFRTGRSLLVEIVESRCLLWGREYVWPEASIKMHRHSPGLTRPPPVVRCVDKNAPLARVAAKSDQFPIAVGSCEKKNSELVFVPCSSCCRWKFATAHGPLTHGNGEFTGLGGVSPPSPVHVQLLSMRRPLDVVNFQ